MLSTVLVILSLLPSPSPEVVMSCSVADQVEQTVYHWENDGCIMEVGVQCDLVISPVLETDSGQYKFQVGADTDPGHPHILQIFSLAHP